MFVVRLGSESGSIVATTRMFAYFESDSSAAMASMYSVLYRARPASEAGSSPLDARAKQSRPGRS